MDTSKTRWTFRVMGSPGLMSDRTIAGHGDTEEEALRDALSTEQSVPHWIGGAGYRPTLPPSALRDINPGRGELGGVGRYWVATYEWPTRDSIERPGLTIAAGKADTEPGVVRFSLRLTADLHERLRALADSRHRSINDQLLALIDDATRA